MRMSPPLRSRAALPRATLGKRRAAKFTYAPRLLEAVPLGVSRAFAPHSLWVSDLCLRFTSLCPVTGQPDWATLHLNYIPLARLVESKSLKEYLGSFRMQGDFHEDVCRIILDDLVRLLDPRYLEVLGHFDARGSIAIWPYAQYARAGDAEALALLAARKAGYAPGSYGPRGPVV
jgi:7-cyano-7-deazaguanine reductase